MKFNRKAIGYLLAFMLFTGPVFADNMGQRQAGPTSRGAAAAITALPVTNDLGGTGATTTQFYETVSGITNASLCGGGFPPSWCAGSDIGAWINAAIAHIGSHGGIVNVDPFSGPYAQTTKVVIPVGIIIEGNGAEVQWAATSGNPYVFDNATFSASASMTLWAIRDLKINHVAGSGDGNTAIAVYAGGDPAGIISTSTHYGMLAKLENVDIRGFSKAFSYGNNVWLVDLDKVRFHNNVVGVNVPSGLTNAGELNRITNSVIHDNTTGISASDYNQNWAISHTSFDYNTKAIAGSGLTAQLTDSHIEQASGSCPVDMSGNSNFNFSNTFLAITSGAAPNGYICMTGNGITFNRITMKNSFIGGSVWPSYIVYTNASTGILESYDHIAYFNSSHVVPYSDSNTTSYGEYAGVSTLWTTGIAEAKQGFKVNGTTVSTVSGTGAFALTASPTFTGSPLAPTQTALDNSTKLATTAYSDANIYSSIVTPIFVDSGNYLGAPTDTTSITTGTHTAGNIYFTPVFVPTTMTFTGIAVNTVVVNTTLFKVGVYAANVTTHKPTGSPITNTATTSSSITTASNTRNDIAFSQAVTLTRGLYWIAVLPDTTGTSRSFSTNSAPPLFGTSTTSDAAGNAMSFVQPYASGLPDMTNNALVDTANVGMLNFRLKVQ